MDSKYKKHSNRHMWSTLDKELINMWSATQAAKSREPLRVPSSAGVVL